MRGWDAIGALYLAEARGFTRDRLTAFLVLLLPVALAVFFGLVFGGGGRFALSLGIVDEDVGQLGAQLVSILSLPETRDTVSTQVGTRSEMLEALREGRVNVVVAFPDGVTASIAARERATVHVFYDAARPTSAGAGLGFVQALLTELDLTLSGSPRLLQVEQVSVHARPLRAVDLYIPGLLGISMLWKGLFGTASKLVQLRETQVLRRLRLTPLRPVVLLAAQIAWRVTLGLLQAVLFLSVGYLAFGVRVVGNWALLAAAVVVGSLVSSSLGYCLAALSPSNEAASALIQIVNFPMMMLSGSLFAIESLPPYLQKVAAAIPLTYLNDSLRQTIVGAAPLHPLWLDFAVLGAWMAFFVAVALRLWRWE